jgi:hypothetical protein
LPPAMHFYSGSDTVPRVLLRHVLLLIWPPLSLERLVTSQQRDQMRLWKNCPKCSPANFLKYLL